MAKKDTVKMNSIDLNVTSAERAKLLRLSLESRTPVSEVVSGIVSLYLQGNAEAAPAVDEKLLKLGRDVLAAVAQYDGKQTTSAEQTDRKLSKGWSMTEEQGAEIEALRAQGYSYAQIQNKTGIHKSSVRRYLFRN